jgi:hypothetical protein
MALVQYQQITGDGAQAAVAFGDILGSWILRFPRENLRIVRERWATGCYRINYLQGIENIGGG